MGLYGCPSKHEHGDAENKGDEVRRNRLCMSLETCKPAIDFDGGRKDPPRWAENPATVGSEKRSVLCLPWRCDESTMCKTGGKP